MMMEKGAKGVTGADTRLADCVSAPATGKHRLPLTIRQAGWKEELPSA